MILFIWEKIAIKQLKSRFHINTEKSNTMQSVLITPQFAKLALKSSYWLIVAKNVGKIINSSFVTDIIITIIKTSDCKM